MAVAIHPESWMSNNPGVYVLHNVSNCRAYIGSTDRTCKRRLKEHIKLLVAGTHHCKPLQVDWNGHGPGVFICGDAINTFGIEALYPKGIPVEWFESALFAAYRQCYGDGSTYNVATIPVAPTGYERMVRKYADQYMQGIGVSVKVVSSRFL